jgi:hypothetical protein
VSLNELRHFSFEMDGGTGRAIARRTRLVTDDDRKTSSNSRPTTPQTRCSYFDPLR